MSVNMRTAIVIVAGVGSLLAGCAPPARDQEIEFRVPVFVKEVGTGTVEDRIVATGTLRSPETIALRADTSGELVLATDGSGRRLREGDRVVPGQTIAEIAGEEVRLAARTDANTQRYAQTLSDHDSSKQLYEDGFLSEQEFLAFETALADAKLELERSRLTESRSKLTTPIGGVILRLSRDEDGLPLASGQLVQKGFVVAQIAPTGSLVADVDVVGPDVARVREQLPVRIRHHAYDGRSFDGQVLRLAPAVDPVTRTLRAEVAVGNDDGALRPGMFVEVTMIVERRDEVPVVPREALTERGGRKVVFVLQGQRVHRRDVVPGLGDDEIVEITSGIEVGERVVVRGLETLTDGTRVRVTGS
jgi:RND family efflux transporter MFP subunit